MVTTNISVIFRLTIQSFLVILYVTAFMFGLTFSTIANTISPEQTDTTEQSNQVNNRVIRIALPDQQSLQNASPERFHLLVNFLKEYWQIWALDNQMTVDFKNMSTIKAFEELKANNIDIIAISTYETTFSDVLYSLPYVHYKQRIYRNTIKHNDNQITVGIADEYGKALEHLPPHIEKHYFNNEANLLKEYQRFNAIYSIRPWRLDSEMEKLGLNDLFYVNSQEHILLPIHFVTRVDDRKLLYLINDNIRQLKSAQTQLWQEKYFEKFNANFTLAFGSYIANLTEKEKEFVIDHPVVRYPVITHGFPPFVITNDNFDNLEDRGYSIDLLDIASEKLGIRFLPVRVNSYQEMIKVVDTGDVDFYSIFETFDEFKDEMRYTSHIADSNYSATFNPSITDFTAMNEVQWLHVALVKGFTYSKRFIEQYPRVKVSYFDTNEQAIESVARGTTDIYIGRALLTGYIIKQRGYTNLTSIPLAEVNPNIGYAFAAPIRNGNIISLLDKVLNHVPNNKLEALFNNYSYASFAETDVQAQIANAYRQVSYIFLAILLISLIIFGIYFRQLQVRKIAQRKIEHALTIAESARQEAEHSAQAKITFLARMSHEIRTPMNGVLGMAEALNFTKLNKEQADLLDTLEGSARHLLALLNDVLDFSKMDAGKMTLESVSINLHLLCQNIIKSFQHIENEQSIELILNIDQNITQNYFTDPTRLNQVLNNLMSNAIKFTEKGHIVLSITRIEQTVTGQDIYDTLRISVKDTGLGISKQKQEKLFSPFIQADNDITRKFGGTGLGLSICQEIVIAMGSRIQINSKEQQGSEFFFDLVMKEAGVESEQEDRRKNNREINTAFEDRFKDLNVLIAEDNLVNVKVLTAQLARLGISADIAYDGAEAFERHSNNRYDIIISDCHMPNMDGFELAERIIQSNQHPIWLIAVTADALSGAAEKCINAGFDDYMAKPCPQEEITNKLNHAYRELKKRQLLAQ